VLLGVKIRRGLMLCDAHPPPQKKIVSARVRPPCRHERLDDALTMVEGDLVDTTLRLLSLRRLRPDADALRSVRRGARHVLRGLLACPPTSKGSSGRATLSTHRARRRPARGLAAALPCSTRQRDASCPRPGPPAPSRRALQGGLAGAAVATSGAATPLDAVAILPLGRAAVHLVWPPQLRLLPDPGQAASGATSGALLRPPWRDARPPPLPARAAEPGHARGRPTKRCGEVGPSCHLRRVAGLSRLCPQRTTPNFVTTLDTLRGTVFRRQNSAPFPFDTEFGHHFLTLFHPR
jgi:hypothetical protein